MPDSRPVDEVIARLTLESGEFQRSAYNAIDTFNKLKTTLSSDIKDNLNSMAAGIDKIASRFDFLGTFQQRLMWRISDGIINMGQNIFRTATSAIRDGWGEYNTKMGSIQTMVGAGYALEDINKSMAQLNEYADKTIYSFSDMTTAMSQFTTMGIDLDKATAAVKGMSNAAGLVGADNNATKRALYNLTQALSMGYMQRVDWKTMTNTGIGGIELKKELIAVAQQLGVIQKINDNLYQTKSGKQYGFEAMFQEGLSDQWMNTDVMMTTFEHVSDVTTEIGKKAYEATTSVKTWGQMIDTIKEDIGSGWSETFEILVGNLDEAKALFTGIKDEVTSITGPIGNFRNDMLLMWKEFGGRNDVLEGLSNIYQSFKVIVEAVVNAFRDVFAPNTRGTAMFLADISSNFKKLTGVIKTVASVLANLIGPPVRIIFSLLKVALSPLRVIHTIITKISTALSLLAAPLSKINELIGIILDPFNQLISAVANFNLDGIKDAFSGIKKLFKPWTEVTKELTNSWVRLGRSEENGGTGEGFHTRIGLDMHDSVISEWIKKFGSGIRDQIKQAFIYMSNIPDSFLNSIGKTGLKIFDTFAELVKGSGGVIFDGLYDILGVIFDIIGAIGGGLWRSLRSVYNFVKSIFMWLTGKTLDTGFNGIKLIASILHGIADAIRFVFNVAYGAVSWVKGTVLSVISTLGKKLQGLWNTLKVFVGKSGFLSNLKSLGKYLSVLGASFKDGALNFSDLKSLMNTGWFNGDVFGSLMNLAGSTISSGFDAIKNFIFSLLPPDIAKELDEFGTALYKAVAPPVQDAWNFMVGLVTDFGKSMDSAKQAVTGFLGEHETLRKAFEAIKNVLTEVWEHIVKYYDAFKAGGFGEMFSTMGEDVKTAFQFVKEFLESPATDNAGIFADLSAGAQAFASISWEAISQSIHDIVKSLTSPEMKDMVSLLMQLTGMYAAVKISNKLGGLLDALKDLAKLSDPLGSVEGLGNRLVSFSKTFSGRVVAIATLAFGLSALAKSFVELSEVPWSRLAVAAGTIVGVFAALALISKLMGESAKNLGGMIALGAGILMISFALSTLLLALTTIQSIEDLGFMAAVLFIFGIFIAFVSFLSRHTLGGELLKAAASIFLFAIGIAVLVGSIMLVFSLLEVLKTLDANTIAMAVGIVVGLAAGVYVIGRVLSKAAAQLNKGNIGWTMVGIASLFMAVAYVFNTIVSSGILNDSFAIQGMLFLMGEIFLGVLALLVVIGLVAKGLQGTGAEGTIKSLGRTFAALGVAFLLIASSIKILSGIDTAIARDVMLEMLAIVAVAMVIGMIAAKVSGTSRALLELTFGVALVAGSMAVLSLIDSDALIKAGKAILAVLAMLLVAAALIGFVPQLASGLMLLNAVLTKFAIIVAVVFLIGAALVALVVYIRNAADGLTAAQFVERLEQFASEVVAYAPRIGVAMGQAVGAMLGGLAIGVVTAVVTFLGTIVTAFNNWVRSRLPALPNEIGKGVGKAFSSLGDSIKKGIQNAVDGVINTVTHPFDSIKNWLFGGGDDTGAEEAAKNKAAAPFKAAKSTTEQEGEELKATTEEAVKKQDEAWSADNLSSQTEFAGIFDGNIMDMVNSAGNLDGIQDKVSSFTSMDWTANAQPQNVDISSMMTVTGGTDLGSTVGNEVIGAMKSGIESGQTDIQNGVTTLTTAADATWKGFDWKSVGANSGLGLADGIRSFASRVAVQNAARQIAEDAINAAKERLKQASPSKVFKEIGMYTTMGFVIGIESLRADVVRATAAMAQSSIDTAQTAMDSMSMRPTVTPVLDISNLEKIPGVGTGLEIPIRADIRGLGSDIDGMTNKIVNSNKSVTTKINELIDKLESVELKIALQPQELDGNVITDTVEEITSIRKLLSDFGKGEA